MQPPFPRKFTHGQKIGNVDVNGKLFLGPDGPFQFQKRRSAISGQ